MRSRVCALLTFVGVLLASGCGHHHCHCRRHHVFHRRDCCTPCCCETCCHPGDQGMPGGPPPLAPMSYKGPAQLPAR
jgi:hypothetical protein